MLRDEGVVVESSWSSAVDGRAARSGAGRDRISERCREIDLQLRRIAKRKAGLEVEEARLLREALEHRAWRKLGFSTALEYLEDVFGYAPRTAKDRMRVAKQLGALPQLEATVRDGELPYSAARELTRVMTPATEAQWLARARGKNLRDIEELVRGHKKGDTPDDPKDPALLTRPFVFELDARRQALLQQVRAILEDERGERIEDADLFEAMCMCVLRGHAAQPHDDAAVRAKAPRPAHQIVIRRCEDCGRTWQQGRGTFVEIAKRDAETAECDAEIVREADLVAAEDAGKRRPAPTVSIPKKTRDLVMARDQGRCRFPGCRATRNIAIHHIEHRAHGGGHDLWNLIVLCDGHHKLLHDGVITITGRAPDQLVFARDGRRLDDARAPQELNAAAALRARSAHAGFEDVVKLEQATQALRQLGFATREARRALDDARAHVGTAADVPTLVKTVLARSQARSAGPEASKEELARQALVQAGFSTAIAAKAVTNACAHVGTDAELPALIKAALRYCV